MDFLDYQKAEKIIKNKEIEEAIKLIPKIVSLCIKKGLDFSLCESAKVIDVTNLETGYRLYGYYSENLVNYKSERSTTIKDIYEQVKSYNHV